MARKRDKDQLSNRARNWSDDETRTLLHIYGEYRFQRKFEGLEKHSGVYMSISKDMEDMGFTGRQWRECKNKITNLKSIFQKENQKLKSGSTPSEWALFNDVLEVLSRRDHLNDSLPRDSMEPVDCEVHLEEEADIMLKPESHHCDESSMNSFASVSSGLGGGVSLSEERPSTVSSKPTTKEEVKVKKTRRRSAEPTVGELHRKIVELMEKRHKLDVAAQARENELAKSMKTFFEVQTELMRAQLRQLNAPPPSYIVTPQSPYHRTEHSIPNTEDKCQQVNLIRPTARPPVDHSYPQPPHGKLSVSDAQTNTTSQQTNFITPTRLLSSVSRSNQQQTLLGLLPGLNDKIGFSNIKVLRVQAPFDDENT